MAQENVTMAISLEMRAKLLAAVEARQKRKARDTFFSRPKTRKPKDPFLNEYRPLLEWEIRQEGMSNIADAMSEYRENRYD